MAGIMGETVLVDGLMHVARGKLDAAIESGVDWTVFLVDDISNSLLHTKRNIDFLNRIACRYKMDSESDAAFIERALRDGHSYERKDGTGPLATIFGRWLVTQMKSRVSGRTSTDAAVDGVVGLPFDLDAPIYNLPKGVEIRYNVYRLESPRFDNGCGLYDLYMKGRLALREPYVVKVKV